MPIAGVGHQQKQQENHAAEVVHSLPSVDMITATSKLQLEAANVRANRPNWKSYLQSQMIPQEDYNYITAYEGAKSRGERTQLVEKNKHQCARTFINLITNVAKDQNVRYILTMLDDMIQEDRSRVDIFVGYAKKQKRSVWQPFVAMLSRQDGFIVNQMSSIIAKMACWGSQAIDGTDLNIYFDFLKRQLKNVGDEYVHTTGRCLQMLLRIDEYRQAFMRTEGVTAIVSALNGKTNFQLQYQLAFCLWCLTFNPLIAQRLHRYGVIQTLADILSESSKEKVIRIILATFRNMLEKVDDTEIVRDDALQMVQSKVLKTIELMEARKFDDPDLTDDMQFIMEKMQIYVQDLSSFDEYCTEIRSGRLQWSPVHKSEKFWRENAQRFNEKNFELIKILIKILQVANDPLVLCVAAHDVGEYVRHYPRGKTVVETLQGKQAVMKLLTADDPNVRYHALLAVQKLMVHNWEYLGKQLDADVETGQLAKPTST